MDSVTEKFFKIKGPNGAMAAVLHQADPERLVILAHGYTGTKCEPCRLFVQTARALAAVGISALRFDFWGSGDSEGDYEDVSPNTEIADLHSVIAWARKRRFSEIGVLGLSMGAAVSICTVAKNPHVKTLVTWSALPQFMGRFDKLIKLRGNPLSGGIGLIKDYPKIDVPESYVSLKIPKLQVQGNKDLEGFMEHFKKYFALASAPKKHVVIPGADHVFSTWPERKKAIRLSVNWFQKYL